MRKHENMVHSSSKKSTCESSELNEYAIFYLKKEKYACDLRAFAILLICWETESYSKKSD